MSDKFIFHGQTTFIDKPRDTVIQNFQNTYLSGDNSEEDKVNIEIGKLIELILKSQKLSTDEKEESTRALHTVAGQIKEKQAGKITTKGTFEVIRDIVSNAADIAAPALAIISTILGLLGLK